MPNTIKFSDNPNEETAFVETDGGQRNRAVLTAVVDGEIEYPANPNSTKVSVTVDGVKRKAVAVATIAGGGGGGDQHNLGYYATQAALEEAHPTAEAGDWAIVGATDTVWIWDTDTSAWKDSDTKGQVTSVNGQTGEVTLTAFSIGAVPNTSTDASSIYVYNDTDTGTSKGSNFIVTSADFSLSNYSYGNIVLTMTNTLANLNFGSVSEATCVGRNIKVHTHATVFGSSSEAGKRGVAIGYTTKAGNYCIGIGFGARAVGGNCIQLNTSTTGAENNDANTFKVANENGNFEIMSADGTVPHGRLTNAVVSNAVTIAVADWNGGTTCTKTVSGLTATSVVWVAPDNASQSDYLTAGVYASAQATDSITFTATTTPTSALTVNVIYC